MKKVVLFASSNPNGATRKVVDQHYPKTDIVNLADYQLDFFKYDQSYTDDFTKLFNKLMEYDHIVFASPIYWYSVCAQMKVFIDRLSDLLFGEKDRLKLLRCKSVSFLGTYATSYNDALKQFQDIFEYLKVELTEVEAIKVLED